MNSFDFETPHPVQLVVNNHAGTVRVHADATDQTNVTLTAVDESAERLVSGAIVDQRGDIIVVRLPRVRGRWRLGRDSGVDIDIRVPTGSSLQSELDVADLVTTGELSDLSVRFGSGSGEIESATGTAKLTSGSGRIRISRVGDLRYSTGSGTLNAGAASGRIDAKCGSGDIIVGQAGERVSASTASGDITIGTAQSAVMAKTASGRIRIREALADSVSASAASGNVEIGVASGTAAWLDLHAMSGRVYNELDAIDQPDGDERQLRLRVKVGSGDITVSRTPSSAAAEAER